MCCIDRLSRQKQTYYHQQQSRLDEADSTKTVSGIPREVQIQLEEVLMKRLRLCSLLFLLSITAVNAHAQEIKVITGATLIDVTQNSLVPDAVVVIKGARVSRVGSKATTTIPANATVIEAEGKFLIPGLADMHNHLGSGTLRLRQNREINLARLLAVGVTAVFNPSSSLRDFERLKMATNRDSARNPHFFGAGPIVTVEGDLFGARVGAHTPETVNEAEAVVSELDAAGVDAIKVQFDDLSWALDLRLPLMKLEVLTALIDEAHGRGLKVFAHAPMLEKAKTALRAGVDALLHGIIDQPIDEEFVSLMRTNEAFYVPTLALYEDVANYGSWIQRLVGFNEGRFLPPAIIESISSPAHVLQVESLFGNSEFAKEHLPVQRANLRRVFEADIPIAMGTDTGFVGVMLGVSSQLELMLLVEAGLEPLDALRTATINAARMIGREEEWGSIGVGKLADLVILDANPLEDIRAIRSIYRVLKEGVVYDPAELLR